MAAGNFARSFVRDDFRAAVDSRLSRQSTTSTPAQQLDDPRCSASLALFRNRCKWSVVVLLVGPKGKMETALLSVFCNHICASTSRGKMHCKNRAQKPPRHRVRGECATRRCVREIRIGFEISDTMVENQRVSGNLLKIRLSVQQKIENDFDHSTG